MVGSRLLVVPYDPSWPSMARAEISRIRGALGNVTVACEHVGSTAVVGCPGRPIIDLLIGTVGWPPNHLIGGTLFSLGYEPAPLGLYPGVVAERTAFEGCPSCDVLVTRFGDQTWTDLVAARNLLRRDRSLVAMLREEKGIAVSAGHRGREDYAARKAMVFALVRARTRG